MSFYMQKDGLKFLAGMLAGSGAKIDGMYVEYSRDRIAAGERSHDKYSLDANIGYIRIPVANAYVDDTGAVIFTGYMTKNDASTGIPLDACIQCVTLVSMDKASVADDIVICTVELKNDIKLLDNSYTVVRAGIRLGDMK